MLLCSSVIFAQFSPGYNWPGDINFTGKITTLNAKETAPIRPVTSDPATCDATNREIILNTTSWQLKVCSTTNTWTVITGTGGSGGGGTYVLPIAGPTTLGGVKIGSGIAEAIDGTISLSGTYSLGTNGAITVTKVAGTGGTTANTLVQLTSTNKVVTSTIGTRGYGIALTTQSSGQNVEVAISGTVQCLADNVTTIGDIAIAGTAFSGYCRDSGTNNVNTISSNVNIVGIITQAVSQGQLVTIQLVNPLINGPNPVLMVGDTGAGGVAGAVAAPAAGDAAIGKFWSAAGVWAVPSFTSGMASEFGDCKVTRISSTQVSVGPNNSPTNACIINFGSTTYRITNPATVNLSGSTTGVLYFWIDNTGSIDVGYPTDATVTCTNCTTLTATSFPNDVITLGTATYTSGSFDTTGVTDYRAIYDKNNITAGIGIQTTESGTSTTISLDSTIATTYQSGTGVPSNSTCTAIGQLYIQSGSSTNHFYQCSFNGSSFSWYQIDQTNVQTGSNVASATTITPTGTIFHITGTSPITTINLPASGFVGCLDILADGAWSTTNSGNIATIISTANVGSLYNACYDGTKWYFK